MSEAAELCVFIPTLRRREQAEKCVQSFVDTVKSDVDLVLVVDENDDSYDGLEFPPILKVKPGTLVTAINQAAEKLAPHYKALMLAADDQIFRTPGWDLFMMATLDVLGGSGIVYPDDKRRADVAEHILMSTDVYNCLGWFAEPSFDHFYIDNVWSELGKRSGLIRYCPQAVIEHMHYSLHEDIERDDTYKNAEITSGQSDYTVFQEWRHARLPEQVSRLRRQFNPDIKWVLNSF